MRKYDLSFEDRDIINDPEHRQEMIQKTGQMLQPCVELDGKMLIDVSGDEVEAYLLANNLVTAASDSADSPTNQPCAHEIDVELTRAEYEDGVPIDFGTPRM